MMPPSLKKLSRESFKGLTEEQGKLVDQLLQILNPFLTSVTNGLNGSLSFADNFTAQIVQVEFYLPDDWVAITNFGTGWSSAFASEPVSCRKGSDGRVYLRNVATGGTPADPVFTLPTGFTPSITKPFPVLVSMTIGGSNERRPGNVTVDDAGVVSVADLFVRESGTDTTQISASTVDALYLDSVSFEAADRTPVVPGSPFPLTVLCSKLPTKPVGLVPFDCDDITSSKPLAVTVPNVTWEPANSGSTPGVLIRNVIGLVPMRRYRLTMLAFS